MSLIEGEYECDDLSFVVTDIMIVAHLQDGGLVAREFHNTTLQHLH